MGFQFVEEVLKSDDFSFVTSFTSLPIFSIFLQFECTPLGHMGFQCVEEVFKSDDFIFDVMTSLPIFF